MNNWKNCKLSDVAKYSNSRISTNILSVENYVSTENMLINRGGKTSASSVPTGSVIKFKKNQTLISNIRPYFKKIWRATMDGGCSADVLVFETIDEINYNYFFYYLCQNNFIDFIMAGAKGTKMPRGDKQQILKYPFAYPKLEEQKCIAATLSCLDEKIELNKHMNKNLEKMAQAFFKSWFIDFLPFQDSEFEDSELGMIPKGWNCKSIYEMAEFINGTSFLKNEYSENGIPIVKIAEIKNGFTQQTQYFSGEKDPKFRIENGDILFSWSGNPQTSIDTYIWVNGEGILNQHIFKVVASKNDFCFVYLLLKFFKPEFTRIATSKQTTGLGHVTIQDLKRLKFPYNETVVENFGNILSPIINKYRENLIENIKIGTLRETLLPKLMSGEIRVPIEEVQ